MMPRGPSLALLALLALATTLALAAPMPAAGGAGHGWFVATAPAIGDGAPGGQADGERADRVLLVHVPPRSAGGGGAGAIRVVAELDGVPEFLAGLGASAIVIDRADAAAGPTGERAVGGVRALRAGLGDVWVFDPPGRLRAEPGLPGWGRVVGAAALERGVAVLLADASVRSGVKTHELHVLQRGRWHQCALPARFASRGRPVGLVALAGGEIGLIEAQGESITLWSGAVRAPARQAFTLTETDESGGLFGGGSILEGRTPSASEPIEVEWSSTTLVPPIDTGGRVLMPASGAMGWAYESLVYALPGRDGSTRVIAASADGGMVLAEVADAAGEGSAFVPMGDRAVLTWVERREIGQDLAREDTGAGDASPRERVWRIHEVSTATGETLFAGPVRQEGPISRREFQAMSIVLVVLMIGLLVFVLRPDPADGVANLPPSTAIAEPGRRVFAGLIDFGAALVTASATFDRPVAELIDPGQWVEGLGGAWSLLAVLLMGLILGTITEWLLGRSLGKSLTGCGVVSVRPGRGAKLSFVQAFGRNAFKWALAPGAAMLLVDASGRHRGDVVTGTAVVVRARDPETPADR